MCWTGTSSRLSRAKIWSKPLMWMISLAALISRSAILVSEFVDLGGEDEVVLCETAGSVGPEVDLQRSVAEVEVGVVAFGLGDQSDAVDQLDAGHEALEAQGPGEDQMVF